MPTTRAIELQRPSVRGRRSDDGVTCAHDSTEPDVKSGAQSVVPSTAGVPSYVGYPYPGALGGLAEAATYTTRLTAAQIANHYALRTKAGVGNGTVTYTVGPNTTASARSTTLTIAGQAVALTQADPCLVTATNTAATFGASGGTISVAGGSACHWTVSSKRRGLPSRRRRRAMPTR